MEGGGSRKGCRKECGSPTKSDTRRVAQILTSLGIILHTVVKDNPCFGAMLLLLGHLVRLICIGAFIRASFANQGACSKEIYGTPRPLDCLELLRSLADINDNHPRLFDEEQLRTPGGSVFPGVKNIYPTQVFQLPGYWSLSRSPYFGLFDWPHCYQI